MESKTSVYLQEFFKILLLLLFILEIFYNGV